MYKDTTTFPELMDIGEAAEVLHVTPTTLRRWDVEKKLRAIRLVQGGKRMYRRKDILALVKK